MILDERAVAPYALATMLNEVATLPTLTAGRALGVLPASGVIELAFDLHVLFRWPS